MNIVFITEADIKLTEGAALSRIVQISKAITFNNVNKVFITSLKYDNKSFNVFQPNKEFNYFFVGEKKKDNRNFFLKKYFSSRKKQIELGRVCEFFIKEKVNTVFVVYNFLDTFYDEILTIKKIKKFGYKILVEKNELSLGIALNLTSVGFYKSISFAILKIINIINGYLTDELVRYYDGGFFISNYLGEFIRKKSRKHFIKIPILYDDSLEVKQITQQEQSNEKLKIGYMGTLTLKRDLLLIILESIKKLKENYNFHSCYLTITGSGNRKVIEDIQNFIDRNYLNNYIKFHGYLDSKNFNIVLSHQEVMIAIRSNTLQGKASFATKIAQYMYAGKILIVNDISDISSFINNGVNGIILEQISSDSLAREIVKTFYLSSVEKENIKLKAVETAKDFFNYQKYANLLQSYISNILITSNPVKLRNDG